AIADLHALPQIFTLRSLNPKRDVEGHRLRQLPERDAVGGERAHSAGPFDPAAVIVAPQRRFRSRLELALEKERVERLERLLDELRRLRVGLADRRRSFRPAAGRYDSDNGDEDEPTHGDSLPQ